VAVTVAVVFVRLARRRIVAIAIAIAITVIPATVAVTVTGRRSIGGLLGRSGAAASGRGDYIAWVFAVPVQTVDINCNEHIRVLGRAGGVADRYFLGGRCGAW